MQAIAKLRRGAEVLIPIRQGIMGIQKCPFFLKPVTQFGIGMVVAHYRRDPAHHDLPKAPALHRFVKRQQHANQGICGPQSSLWVYTPENGPEQGSRLRVPGERVRVVINHQPPTWPDLTSQRCYALLGRGCVLKYSKAHHGIKLSRRKWERQYVCLRYQMPSINRKIPGIGYDRFTQVYGRHRRPTLKKHLREPASTTTSLQNASS
jgi:hypothetical protein